MGKGSSGKKQGNAAKRNRARYKVEGRYEKNKLRKARTENAKQVRLLKEGKGALMPKEKSVTVTPNKEESDAN